MTSILCLYFILTAVISSPATAGEQSLILQFTGRVKTAPCIVENDAVTVDLGKKLQARWLDNAGSGTEWVNFSLNLKECPSSTRKAIMTFNGTPAEAPQDATMYKNTGSAQNVAVELQTASGTNLGDGQSVESNVVNTQVIYNLRARVYTSTGGAQAGSVNSVVTFTLSYP